MRLKKVYPRIGILALMQGLYDESQPDIPADQTAFIQGVIKRLDGTAEYVFPGLAKERSQIEKYVRDFQMADLDGIMIVNVMYSPGLKLVQAFKRNHLPVLVANIQPLPEVEPYWNWHYLTTNQGIHGAQDTAGTLLRLGCHPAVITEDWKSEAFVSFVRDWALASAAVRALSHTRAACMEKMKNMGDILGDEFAFFKTFGMELLHEGIGGVLACMDKVTEEEIDIRIASDRQNFEIEEQIPEESHRYAACLQLA
ncbi:MAG: arabinose isomerase, partial [Eubacterium sp.]|nr:arabinose isomerase [Eubacterium sp.]